MRLKAGGLDTNIPTDIEETKLNSRRRLKKLDKKTFNKFKEEILKNILDIDIVKKCYNTDINVSINSILDISNQYFDACESNEQQIKEAFKNHIDIDIDTEVTQTMKKPSTLVKKNKNYSDNDTEVKENKNYNNNDNDKKQLEYSNLNFIKVSKEVNILAENANQPDILAVKNNNCRFNYRYKRRSIYLYK